MRFRTVLALLSILPIPGTARAQPDCVSATLPAVGGLTNLPSERIDEFEADTRRALSVLPQEKLEAGIRAALEEHLTENGYLPGLSPEWNLTSYEALLQDLRAHRAEFAGSRFANYLANVTQIADLNRQFLRLNKGDRSRYLRDYLRFFREAERLRELRRRAEF